tara:strand:- start:7 stop:276 length:270 start_codon:yes stop_codon:yes gene_type:complete
MLNFTVKLTNQKGLHARASAKFVEVVDSFDAKCEVSRDETTVSGDSVMSLLMLAASNGTKVQIKVWGKEKEKLKKALITLITNKFGEEN